MAQKEKIGVVKMLGKHSASCERRKKEYCWALDRESPTVDRDRNGGGAGWAYTFYRFKCTGCGSAAMLVSADMVDDVGAAAERHRAEGGKVTIS